jgi:Ca-activated chloride channel family protein
MRYVWVLLISLLLLGASIEDARKANDAYDEGNYEEAISLYKKAIDADPENEKLHFNLASALAKAGQSEQAIRTFEQYKSMTERAEEKAKANYNIGKVFSDNEKWDKAVDYFKQSLRYMAGDTDAKHNFELAKKKKQEQKNKQNKNQQNQQNQQKNNEQNQNQQKDRQQQDQNQQEQQQNQQNQQNKDQQNQQQQQSQKMSKAQAQKILKALEQKEKELLKQFKKQETESSKSSNEKDW